MDHGVGGRLLADLRIELLKIEGGEAIESPVAQGGAHVSAKETPVILERPRSDPRLYRVFEPSVEKGVEAHLGRLDECAKIATPDGSRQVSVRILL